MQLLESRPEYMNEWFFFFFSSKTLDQTGKLKHLEEGEVERKKKLWSEYIEFGQ